MPRVRLWRITSFSPYAHFFPDSLCSFLSRFNYFLNSLLISFLLLFSHFIPDSHFSFRSWFSFLSIVFANFFPASLCSFLSILFILCRWRPKERSRLWLFALSPSRSPSLLPVSCKTERLLSISRRRPCELLLKLPLPPKCQLRPPLRLLLLLTPAFTTFSTM